MVLDSGVLMERADAYAPFFDAARQAVLTSFCSEMKLMAGMAGISPGGQGLMET